VTVPDDYEASVLGAQASVILSALDGWLRGAPGRIITMVHELGDGIVVTLHETHTSRGESLRDAAAQVATVAALEASP
jgi:hypothetical protein